MIKVAFYDTKEYDRPSFELYGKLHNVEYKFLETKLTEDTAVTMMRSHKVIAMSAANAKDDALNWLRQFLGMSSALVLNVAGPRESKAPGVQARAKVFLEELLWEV